MTMKWEGPKVQRIIESAMIDAVSVGADVILGQAVKKAPRDTGTLRRSGTVTYKSLPNVDEVYPVAQQMQVQKEPKPEHVQRNNIKAYVSFNTPYAHKQHEDLTLNHPREGEAKYLENALDENKGRVKTIVEKEMKRQLKRRGL